MPWRSREAAFSQIRLCGDAGFTLIEVLVAVVIFALSIVAIVGAMTTSISSSALNREQATAETELRSFAELLIDPPSGTLTYVPCATLSSYRVPSGFPSYPGFKAPSVTSVEVWNGANPPVWQSSSDSPCTDTGLQQITIKVQSTNDALVETMTVLKPNALDSHGE